MEKFCPACSRVYNEEADHCEVDGERLVLLNEEPSLVGHVLDMKYTLLSKLGEGGMGSVYLAEQSSMGREVAIKVLRREYSQNKMAIKRFLREARAASKLAHPNTITVYDFGQSNDGLLYLVMERLSGRPLADILDSDGPMVITRAVHIISQICDSLQEAHKQGITHRDLKPENIFIEQKVGNVDFVKVLDFGIAKMQGDDTTTSATATGMICGTPSYMSPEQAMGKDIDGRSDIYALGILLYEMITNVKPFEGDTPMEVMLKHINEPSPNVYERTGIAVPEGIQDVLDKMLAKKAPDRPADCQEAKHLMIAALGSKVVGPIVSTQDPSLPKKRRDEASLRISTLEKTGLSPAVFKTPSDEVPARRARWPWVAATVVLLGVGVAAAAVVLGGAPGDPAVPSNPGAVAKVTQQPPLEGHVGGSVAPVTETEKSSAAKTVEKSVGDGVKPTDPVKAADPASGAVAGAVVVQAATRGSELADAGTARAGGDGGDGADKKEAPPVVIPKVQFALDSVPTGAEVYEGEALVGTTPIVFARTRESGTMKVTFKAKGYQSQTVELATIGDVKKTVALLRARGPTLTLPTDPTKKGGFGTF